MYRPFLILLTLLSLSVGIHAAETKTPSERFFGKITAVDTAQKQVTVHNTRQDLDATFHWDEKTDFISNKKSIEPQELKVGQSLAIYYGMENNVNKARKVSVRTPFKKSQQTNN